MIHELPLLVSLAFLVNRTLTFIGVVVEMRKRDDEPRDEPRRSAE